MKYDKSKTFFNAFNNLFAVNSETRKQAIDAYPHNTAFTDFIIDEINNIIKAQGMISQNEYYRIDSMGYMRRYTELEKRDRFNPHLWDLEIAVEHENDPKDWLDEVIKLAHICCPLRVVIGYMPADKRSEDQALLDYAADALKRLHCADNVTKGEFMIILGNSNTRGNVEKYFHYQAYVLNANTFRFENVFNNKEIL